MGSVYEHRFGPWFVEPVIAGLNDDGTPFISAMDLIGAPVYAEDFVLAGTPSEEMFGMAESLWRPDMDAEVSPLPKTLALPLPSFNFDLPRSLTPPHPPPPS